MTVALLLVALHWPVTPPQAPPLALPRVERAYAVGYSYHYHVGIMARVAAVRGMRLDWTADGFASVPNCKYVNARRPWYVLASIGGRRLRLQIIDCSNPRDRAHQRRIGLMLEVDWQTAHRGGWATYHGDTGPGRARAVVWGYTQP